VISLILLSYDDIKILNIDVSSTASTKAVAVVTATTEAEAVIVIAAATKAEAVVV
jgi:hypothetical protein